MTANATTSRLPPFVVGTSAYNTHAQNMVQALFEAGALERYLTGGVDVFDGPVSRALRASVARFTPGLDRELRRRAITAAPARLVESHWGWEAARLAANRLGAPRVEDWCWERGEWALDRLAARLVRKTGAAFLGVEHGALASLERARAQRTPAVLAFLSPHHRTRARWVDVEYGKFPELQTAAGTALQRLAVARDARRDREAETADWIVTNSSFTTRSLVENGVPPSRVLTVPLAAPDAVPASALPRRPPSVARFVYAGPVSVRKGAHYLLRAWRLVAASTAELHLYGAQTLPAALIAEARAARGGDRIFVHGSVPAATLPDIYQQATALVLPTLCDGFGQVISDALACGLPVITTFNAGGADLVRHEISGFVIPPADADALAGALDWCLSHPDAVLAMREAARQDAAGWTWQDYRRAFVRVLSTAISTGTVAGARPEAPAVLSHA